MTPSGIVTPTGAIATRGLPAAAGGVDVAGALTSVIPGIRKLKKVAVTAALPAGYTGGLVQLELPKASYMQRANVRITGNIKVKLKAEKESVIKKVDPRRFIQKFEFSLSGSTNPRVLTGIQSDTIDNLDLPAESANLQTYEAPAPAKGATAEKAFAIEMSPQFCVSSQNLYGIPYLGAPSTVPQFNITFGNPNGTLVSPETAENVESITFEGGKVEVSLWRIDLPAPVMPRQIVTEQNGKRVVSEIPGQGLYQESSYMLLSRMYEEQASSQNGVKLFQLPIGPDYTRIIVLAYTSEGVLDTEASPIIKHIDLSVQQATVIESKNIWEFDNEYRHLYNKERPKGVYVFSGIDETGTDADLYVTRELGNFDLEAYFTENESAKTGKIQVITQELVPLSEPGIYL